MTYTEFMDNIYTWAAGNAGVLVIFADQNAPRPDENYITLKDTGINTIGHRDYGPPDNITEERIVKYEDEITISIQGYGENTINALQLLKESLKKEYIILQFEQMKIASRREESIRNVSSLIDNEIEKRYSFEVTFGIANSFTEEVGIIENFEYTGTYEDPV